VFFGLPYENGFPRFVRVIPGLDSFANTPHNNWVIGSDQDDVIASGSGDDVIYGGPGNDTIDGGSGFNAAYYLGARPNFSIYPSNGKIVVKDNTGVEGTDTLSNIQSLIFSDGTVALAQINQGWNLTGNPTDAMLNVATIFNAANKVASVWKWSANKWAFYSPAMTGQQLSDYATARGYDVLTTINGGEGYWVNAKATFTAQLPAGNPIASSQFIGMASGWNLVSVGNTTTPSGFNIDISATPPAAGVVPQNFSSLWAWDSSTSKWYF
jgi:hypothetical protein